jgi:hypothetical protein
MTERNGKTPATERRYWLDDPANVKKIVYGLVILCVATVLADFFYHKHVHYDFQGWPGFDAVYGFVCCVGLVLAAKQLRKILMRGEDYYE